jgi:ABC-type transport system involved in multi-copper enzyme maturation permease subunit
MWRKDWSEIRWLTLVGFCVVVGMTLFSIGDPDAYRRNAAPDAAIRSRPAETFVQYNSRSLEILLPALLGGTALLLGIGGLGHERSSGTASFTLALPYSRRAIVTSRFITGAVVVVTLAVAAHLTVTAWAAIHYLGAEYPVSRALGMAACLAAGSLFVYGFTFFIANVTANTVRTVATSVLLLWFLVYAAGTPYQAHAAGSLGWWLQPANFFKLMSGAGFLMRGRIPWLGIAGALGVTGALGYLTSRWVERHDF